MPLHEYVLAHECMCMCKRVCVRVCVCASACVVLAYACMCTCMCKRKCKVLTVPFCQDSDVSCFSQEKPAACACFATVLFTSHFFLLYTFPVHSVLYVLNIYFSQGGGESKRLFLMDFFLSLSFRIGFLYYL